MKGYSLVRVEVCHTCQHNTSVDTRMMTPFCKLHEQWVSPIGKCKAYRISGDATERYDLDEYNNITNGGGL